MFPVNTLSIVLVFVVCALGQNGNNFQETHLNDIIKIFNGVEPNLDILYLLGRIIVNENDIKFYLYTPEIEGNQIDRTNLEQLNPDLPIKIIIHGWGENSKKDWYKSMTKEYLAKGNCNVIQVDWERPASYEYVTSALNCKQVGEKIGRFIIDLYLNQRISLENVHIIGHSLGAHVAGFAGKEVLQQSGDKIGRISALDPAGPYFERPPKNPADRLSNNDAKLVDVVHTDGGFFGSSNSIGTIDFYMNGGIRPQPGCIAAFFSVPSNLESLVSTVFCSHVKSYLYFIESINSHNYQAVQCDSWKSYKRGKCEQNEKATFGENLESGKKGNFYIAIDH